jgi:hypothetical protein
MTAIDWSSSVNIIATNSGPSKGTGFVKMGEYYDDGEFIDGFGLIRFGPNVGRGSGFYMLTLPVPAKNNDPEGFTIINGTVTIGWSLTHRVGNLHVCGIEGYENNSRAVVTIDNALFIADDNPNSGGALGNIHWSFRYPKE